MQQGSIGVAGLFGIDPLIGIAYSAGENFKRTKNQLRHRSRLLRVGVAADLEMVGFVSSAHLAPLEADPGEPLQYNLPMKLLYSLSLWLLLWHPGWAQERAADPWIWHDQPMAYFGGNPDAAAVVKVTTLAASGSGSLREAIEAESDGPRLIVFEVGGVIDLEGRGIKIEHDGTWIAGQTAPAPGITLVRGGLSVNASHIILQHLRVRPGDQGARGAKKWEPDGIATVGANHDILIEHCSATWSIDENLSASGYDAEAGKHAGRIVFRNNIIAQGLHEATHSKGGHSKGSLILDGTREVAIVGNLYAGNVERNPVFKLDTSGVIVNNVMACPGERAIHASVPEADSVGKLARLSVVGNTVLLGPESKVSTAIFEGSAEAFFNDNAGTDAQGRPLPPLRRVFQTLDAPPLWPAGLRARPAAQALWHVARFAGARPAERDGIDRRIVGEALSGALKIIDSQSEVGGYPKTGEPAVARLAVPAEHRDDWLETLARSVEGRTLVRPTSKRPEDLTKFAAATVHPLATEAAIAAYDKGGNAIDAAIAAAITLGVVDAHNSGIGGGCFILIRAADGTITAIDGRETAPAAATRDLFIRDGKGDTALSQTGALASGVPGSLAAWELALAKHGTLKLGDLLRPAADLAERGFPIDRVFAGKLASAAGDIAKFPASAAIFLKPDGKTPLAEGDKVIQKDLAASYRAIADAGSAWFYRGPFSEKTAAWMRENGGIMTEADFSGYVAKEREPLVTGYRGHDIIGFPPPSSGGVHVAQMLNMLDTFDLAKMEPAPRAHILAETMKLAFADRAHWLGDPDFAPVPRGLIDPAYAKSLATRIDPARASAVAGHGTPPRAGEDVFGDFDKKHTQHLCAADAEGNWVTMTSTINTGFGSKVVIPGTGILLNNQMDDFSVQPGVPNAFGLVGAEANAVGPGKRPLSSMSPTLVLREGRVIMAVGAAGGPTIISQTVQAIVNRIDLKMDVEDSLAAPRLHHQWSPGSLRVEKALDPAVIESLKALGHDVAESGGIGATQAITYDGTRGLFRPAHDPRVPGGSGGR
jgi:gamma-glutamyltranspeptidase/glutathione hydrolase